MASTARRKYMIAGITAITIMYLPACRSKIEKTIGNRKRSMTTVPTKEELALLNSAKANLARHDVAVVKISNRLFDKGVSFNSFLWEGLEFQNCDFVECVMLKGALKRVKFSNCLFIDNRLEDGRWEEVVFEGCSFQGTFKMGTSIGGSTLAVTDCEFQGSTFEELGYGGKEEFFGNIGGTKGNVTYTKCKFERTFINGGLTTEFSECKFDDVGIDGPDGSSVTLLESTATGPVDFGSKMGNFSSITLRNSAFEKLLTFDSAKIKSALFEDMKANVDLTRVKADSIVFRRVKFQGAASPRPGINYGLTTQSAKITALHIEDCLFELTQSGLFLAGEENMEMPVRFDANGREINLYSTDIGTLSIRNTPIKSGKFGRMRIGTLDLHTLRVAGLDLFESQIGNFNTHDVSMEGDINYDKSVIKQRKNEGGSHTAKTPSASKKHSE